MHAFVYFLLHVLLTMIRRVIPTHFKQKKSRICDGVRVNWYSFRSTYEKNFNPSVGIFRQGKGLRRMNPNDVGRMYMKGILTLYASPQITDSEVSFCVRCTTYNV